MEEHFLKKLISKSFFQTNQDIQIRHKVTGRIHIKPVYFCLPGGKVIAFL
jgi:hypothetical protein